MLFAIDDEQATQVLTPAFCLASARAAFREHAADKVTLTTPRVERLALEAKGSAGYRVKGAVFHRPGIAGVRIAQTVLLSEYPSMRPLGFMNERTAYARRVGAVAAATLEALDKSRFDHLCLFGAGKLARSTLIALAHRYDLGEIAVLSRTASSRQVFAEEFRVEGLNIRGSDDPENAVRRSDLVVTMTDADEPLFRADWVGSGTAIVSMGGGLELDFDLLDSAAGIFVDDLEGCLESGDLARAREAGRYDPERITGSVADLLAGQLGLPEAGPILFIPRGMASMDVMQAIRVAEIAGLLPSRLSSDWDESPPR